MNFMKNSMERYQDIMKQADIEMARELDRMPIGKFKYVCTWNFVSKFGLS